MPRLLYVTPSLPGSPRGGRAQLSHLHCEALSALLPGGFAVHRLAPASSGLARSVVGWIDGATPAGIAAALTAADRQRADTVWLDGSNLGRLAQALRRARPGLRVITFCHNVEARFFLGALRRRPRLRAAGVLAGNLAAERLAMRHSHRVIVLSRRDGNLLERLYGRAADHILPMAVADQLRDPRSLGASIAAAGPFLFVGGAFYANQAGIAWFARQVAPRVNARIEVVGQGIDVMRTALEAASNLRVIGPVDALEPHYRAALAVIAPIFDGSGMKTKVAEALMFGKHILGSPEAFSGYAADVVSANRCCVDADAFIAAIQQFEASPPPAWDPTMRALYERDHSLAATRTRLAGILGVVTIESSR